MSIHNDDKELFRNCREIWNKITELIVINSVKNLSETTLYDGDEIIMVDVHKITSFVEGNNKNKLVIVLHSVLDDYLQTSLVQHINTHKYFNIFNVNINHINKHKEKYTISARIPQLL